MGDGGFAIDPILYKGPGRVLNRRYNWRDIGGFLNLYRDSADNRGRTAIINGDIHIGRAKKAWIARKAGRIHRRANIRRKACNCDPIPRRHNKRAPATGIGGNRSLSTGQGYRQYIAVNICDIDICQRDWLIFQSRNRINPTRGQAGIVENQIGCPLHRTDQSAVHAVICDQVRVG